MSAKKTDATAKVLDLIELPHQVPDAVPNATLVEQGLYAILLRHLTVDQAKSGLARLQKRYQDWNELRVAQAQEIAGVMRGPKAKALAAARDSKTYFQEVFQQSHGLELEFLREDFQSAARFINQLPFLGLATANWLLNMATDPDVLVTPAIVRVLDRLGIVARSASQRKARAAIEPIVPKGKAKLFGMSLGHVAQSWCDPRKPTCWDCPLVEVCKHGHKVKKDWLVQQERLEAQRAREEARQAKIAKQEEERRKREEAAAAKKAEAVAAKKAREEERKRKALERERAKKARQVERVRKQAEREKAAAAKEKAKLAAEKKKAAEQARKEAAAKKKAAAAKKKATKKVAKKATKKKVVKKTAKKATKKKVVKKAAKATKKTTRKVTKKTAKKATTRKSSTATKKKAAKKVAKKASKKKVTKKATKKKARKR